MKKSNGSNYDASDIGLAIVLVIFLAVLGVSLWAAVGTWAINQLLVLFDVNMPPFSVWQGLQIMSFLWLIGLMTRGLPRGRSSE
jgi:hypothetical protein